MDSLLNRLMPRTLGSWPRLAWHDGGAAKLEWSPSADISETDRERLVRAELPAVKKEDVNVTVDGGILTIQGERKQRTEESNEKHHRVETLQGSFTRSFTLPGNVDVSHINCESRDGVLTVHIPKTVVEKRKPLEIKVQ
jgi:HSP20 family protein